MKKLLTIFLLSISSFTVEAQTTCTASTTAQLNACFVSTTSPNIISLTATITLSGTLSVPNNTYILYTNGYNVIGSSWSWATAGTGSVMNLARNASATSIPVGKNGTYKFADINTAGSLAGAFSTLPVELLDFKVQSTQKGNELTWATANEVNNKGFSVERQNGNDWETLGFIAAKGKGTYAFTDEAPLSISYYRLRQVDNDGAETVSKILTIKRDKSGEVKIFPSITTDNIRVESAESIESVEILNTLGQVVLSQKGDNTLVINMNHLTSGLYVVRVALSGAVVSQKVFKQ